MVNKQSARLFRSFRRLGRGAKVRRFSRTKVRLYGVRVRNCDRTRASYVLGRFFALEFSFVRGSYRVSPPIRRGVTPSHEPQAPTRGLRPYAQGVRVVSALAQRGRAGRPLWSRQFAPLDDRSWPISDVPNYIGSSTWSLQIFLRTSTEFLPSTILKIGRASCRKECRSRWS